VKSKIGYGKNKDIFIEYVDLDELNLIVDGEKLTEARAAAMGEELAKEAHRILRKGNPKYRELD
jgi:histidine ammonia-lyase